MKHVGSIKMPIKTSSGVKEFSLDFFKTGKERYAILYLGDLKARFVPLRIESACLFGHVFHSAKCDCGFQLNAAIDYISQKNHGLVIYAIDQDGRGLGIEAHFRIYVLRQQKRHPTKKVYSLLNKRIDERNYSDILSILRYYGVRSVELMTNNQSRISTLTLAGLEVKRKPLECPLNEFNETCLRQEKDDLDYLTTYQSHIDFFSKLSKNENEALVVSGNGEIVKKFKGNKKTIIESVEKEVSLEGKSFSVYTNFLVNKGDLLAIKNSNVKVFFPLGSFSKVDKEFEFDEIRLS